MKNKELIALLEKLPPEATVWCLRRPPSRIERWFRRGLGMWETVSRVETVTKESTDTYNEVHTTQADIYLEATR
jgi:hypothetical protein